MEQFELKADLRTKCGKGNAHELRKKGKIPAVFYGRGQENLHLAVSPVDLEKAVAGEKGMNTLIKLNVADKGDFSVMIRDYQADPIRRHFLHADFIAVDLTQKVEISIPIHLTGRPVGVKDGGILEQVTRELAVLCLPVNIPKQIDVDVTPLKIGQNLHLDAITLPEGVEPKEKINVTIAAVIAMKEEEDLTPGTMTEPEVLTAKKEEGAVGEAAAAAPTEKGKEGGAKGEAKAPAKAPEKKAPEKK